VQRWEWDLNPRGLTPNSLPSFLFSLEEKKENTGCQKKKENY